LDITLLLTILQVIIILAMLATAGKIGRILDRMETKASNVRVRIDDLIKHIDKMTEGNKNEG